MVSNQLGHQTSLLHFTHSTLLSKSRNQGNPTRTVLILVLHKHQHLDKLMSRSSSRSESTRGFLELSRDAPVSVNHAVPLEAVVPERAFELLHVVLHFLLEHSRDTYRDHGSFFAKNSDRLLTKSLLDVTAVAVVSALSPQNTLNRA